MPPAPLSSTARLPSLAALGRFRFSDQGVQKRLLSNRSLHSSRPPPVPFPRVGVLVLLHSPTKSGRCRSGKYPRSTSFPATTVAKRLPPGVVKVHGPNPPVEAPDKPGVEQRFVARARARTRGFAQVRVSVRFCGTAFATAGAEARRARFAWVWGRWRRSGGGVAAPKENIHCAASLGLHKDRPFARRQEVGDR